MAHTVRRHRWLVLALVTGLGLAALVTSNVARLQAQDAGRPAGSTYVGKAFTFNEVVPGVYHAVGTGTLAVGCNASVIVNADDVMVIDTNLSPGAAWALREELKALTTKPVRVTRITSGGVGLTTPRPATTTLRVRFSPYFALTAGRGCVGRAPGGWTRVRLDRAGPATLGTRFSLRRIGATKDRCER